MAAPPLESRFAGEPRREGQAETDDQPLVDALVEHHRGIERAIEAAAVKARGDLPLLTAGYESLERELLRHMEIEERDLLPLYERSHPEEARELRGEHDAIRERLFELGLTLDLHHKRADALNDLAILLRAHTAREELGLYPWLEQNVTHATWEALGLALVGTERPGRSILARN
jgi:hemerythrin-like domain-containing protein